MDSGESRSGNNDATWCRLRERKRERGAEKEIDNSVRCFFASSMSGSKALYSRRAFINALNRHAPKEKECTLVSAHVLASLLLPLSVLPSSLYASCRVMHIFLNRPGNCTLNISELFSRHERAYSARFSERGRSGPPAFILHLSLMLAACLRCTGRK